MDKEAFIKGLPYSDEIKGKLREMVQLGLEADREAEAYIQGQYGLKDDELGAVSSCGRHLATSTIMVGMMEAFSADKSLANEDRQRLSQAVMDYTRIILKNYFKSKDAVGLQDWETRKEAF